MNLNMLVLAGAVSAGVAVGAIGHAFHGSAQAPVAVAELVKRDLASPGKEGSIFLVELAPGAAVGRHYHPGDAFAYILEGSMVLEVEGKPPVTLKPGDSGHVVPRQVHDDKNASAAKPVKFLVFHVAEKGQPLVSCLQRTFTMRSVARRRVGVQSGTDRLGALWKPISETGH